MEHSDKGASRASLDAMLDMDAHNRETDAETIPEGDAEAHSRSQAAHLHESGSVHTKPAGNLRQGSAPGERREPPQGEPKHQQ